MMWDNCAACEEKNTDMEYMQNQLDSIRLLIETDMKLGMEPITVRYHSLSELVDNIYGVLE